MKPRLAEFFAFARERHAIYLRRRSGLPAPWTRDPVLAGYRFCNVFRELDTTTAWFREHVREPLRAKPEVLLATVLFRWFNRIRTGEAIFKQESLGLGGEKPGETAWEAFLRLNDVGPLRASVLQYCGDGPYVTGAYIIKTPDGKDKLDGVLWCVEQFILGETKRESEWDMEEYAYCMLNEPGAYSLQEVWDNLRQFPYMGDFMAYEVVTDLRHTALLHRAPDVDTWANPGPGAARGLGRLFADDPAKWNRGRDRVHLIELMRVLLEGSRDPAMWPQRVHDEIQTHEHYREQLDTLPPSGTVYWDWPRWELREVEHTLCEWDKYERARLGEGRLKRRYP